MQFPQYTTGRMTQCCEASFVSGTRWG